MSGAQGSARKIRRRIIWGKKRKREANWNQDQKSASLLFWPIQPPPMIVIIIFWKGLSLGLKLLSLSFSLLLSLSPSLKEAANYFPPFANTLFSALTTPDTFLNKLIDNHPCDGGCQGINGFPATNQRAAAPPLEPSLAGGFCMKGGGACRAAGRAGEAGGGRGRRLPQPACQPLRNLCIPSRSNRSHHTPFRRKWVNSPKTTIFSSLNLILNLLFCCGLLE